MNNEKELSVNSIRSELEEQLALQCAPVLAGIKISNLLIVSGNDWKDVIRLFYKSDISLGVVYKSDIKTAFLLYREIELEAYLNRASVNELMLELGYSTMMLKQLLKEFASRYCSYMNGNCDFPHELGLLLGYPTTDVIGFMQNKGKNYLYSGYWKVYDNLTETINIFNNYKQAKEGLLRLIHTGVSIQDIIRGKYCAYY